MLAGMEHSAEEGVPPMGMGAGPAAGGGGAEVLRMVISLLEQEQPQVDEALRVAHGGL
eukprot:COSAG02_NODE_22576_length_747_cov_2.106481_1_plen_57_part_01